MTFNQLKFLWYADLYRYYGKGDVATLIKMLFVYWEPPGYRYTFFMRLCCFLQHNRFKPITSPLYVFFRVLLKHYEYKFGMRIPPNLNIGPGLYIGHHGDIGVNQYAVLGKNCNISQGVSIGQSGRGKDKGSPVIGDNVFVGPGAKVFGRIRIGNNVVIGANAVVTKDVPNNAVVVGVPGKVISYAGTGDYILYTDYILHTHHVQSADQNSENGHASVLGESMVNHVHYELERAIGE